MGKKRIVDSDSDDDGSDYSEGAGRGGHASASASASGGKVAPAVSASKAIASTRDESSDDEDSDDFASESDFDDSPKKKKAKKAAGSTSATPKKAASSKAKSGGSSQAPSASNGIKKAVNTSSGSSVKAAANPLSSTAALSGASSKLSTTMTSISAAPGSVLDTHGPEITSESAAKKIILQYMRQQNRPYSAIQVYDNLHKRAPKSVVEKVLTSLSEPATSSGGGLICKEYGKAKIYFVDQDTLPSNVSEECSANVEREIDQLHRQQASLESEAKLLRIEIVKQEEEPADEDLDRVMKETELRIANKRERSSKMASEPVDKAALGVLIREHNRLRGLWKTRKDNCMDCIERIAEGANKKLAVIMSDLGIETDDPATQKVPTAIPEPRK